MHRGKHGTVVLTALSVVLSAAVGIVGNVLVGSWGWALLSALLVLVSGLAIVEIVRHRADRAAAAEQPWTPPEGHTAEATSGVSIVAQSLRFRGQMAGNNAYQVKVGTGGFALVAVALLLGGGSTYLGTTDASVTDHARAEASPAPAVPPTSPPTPSPDPASTTPAPKTGSKGSGGLTTSGRDLDPDDTTSGTADISFQSKQNEGGLALLNNTALAPIPAGTSASEDTCRSASGYSTEPLAMPIPAGLSRCLRTSDGRYGVLNVTSAESNALGGIATISWTVW